MTILGRHGYVVGKAWASEVKAVSFVWVWEDGESREGVWAEFGRASRRIKGRASSDCDVNP